MEDKMLKICKEVVKAKIIPCENEDILCRDCIFNVCEDCKNYKITSEIAQKYIEEHEKTVNTIEKIEKKITLKELQEMKKDIELKGTVDAKTLPVGNLKDMVNHPSHYTHGKYEAIDVIEDWKLNFNLGNTVKYIARAGYKDNIIQELNKSLWYLQREINRLEKENNSRG